MKKKIPDSKELRIRFLRLNKNIRPFHYLLVVSHAKRSATGGPLAKLGIYVTRKTIKYPLGEIPVPNKTYRLVHMNTEKTHLWLIKGAKFNLTRPAYVFFSLREKFKSFIEPSNILLLKKLKQVF